jgi:hypothetical protein
MTIIGLLVKMAYSFRKEDMKQERYLPSVRIEEDSSLDRALRVFRIPRGPCLTFNNPVSAKRCALTKRGSLIKHDIEIADSDFEWQQGTKWHVIVATAKHRKRFRR